eukprot:6197842-Pleurochrysis_carterae.AAC.3
MSYVSESRLGPSSQPSVRGAPSALASPPCSRHSLLARPQLELTAAQKRLYRAIIERNLEQLQRPSTSLRNVFMQLRKTCNHATLVEARRAAVPVCVHVC